VCFEKFLELFATAYPEDLHIIQLDNGGFHSSLNLSIPENVILLFQPAYSPEILVIFLAYLSQPCKGMKSTDIRD
jgi:hypothetical protein